MRKAIIVTGLGFGDEGKGSITDFLVRKFNAHTVVRYNGSGQAAHNVVLPNGTHHTFSQFGAGTFAGAKTFLSKYTLLEPMGLIKEAEHLIKCRIENPYDLLSIDRNCKLVTPYHRFTNRYLEQKRGKDRHGSCGIGAGQAMDDYVNYGVALTVEDLFSHECFNKINELYKIHRQKWGADKVPDLESDIYNFFNSTVFLRERGVFAPEEHFSNILNADGNIVFEGAQGVLIDEYFGFYPHTTWSTCTAENATNLLLENDYLGQVIKLGLTRVYATRHGNGPFPTMAAIEYSDHNKYGEWQGDFRFGYLDLPLLNYAIKCNKGINGLVLNHLDQIDKEIKVCIGYEPFIIPEVDFEKNDSKLIRQQILGEKLDKVKPILITVKKESFIDFLEQKLNIKIVLISSGPTYSEKTLTIEAL
jgi:adenylosuccinate synthase